MQSQREQDARTFLDVLFEKVPRDAITTLSFVTRGSTATWQSSAYNVTNREQMVKDALNAKTQVYVRVPPMAQRPERGRGLETDSLGSAVLWGDLDCYDAQEQGIAQLQALDKPPTLIVNSGYGLQAYWVLDRFYEGILPIKKRNKALAALMNGGSGKDRADSVYDLARVMRMPGSFNLKQQFPALVTIVSYEPDRVYSLGEFEEAELEADNVEIHSWEEEPLAEDFLDQIKSKDPKLAARMVDETRALKAGALARKSDAEKVDRSRNDQYIAIRLLSLGYSPGVVMSVLTHSTWLSGSRWREKRSYDYVVTTANKATQKIKASPDRYFSGRSFVPSVLGAELAQSQPFIYVAEQLWHYQDGVYQPDGRQHVLTQALSKLGDRWKPAHADETARWLQDSFAREPDDVNQFRGLVNLKNGMLDIKTGELLPHNARYASLVQLPVIYDPEADTSAVDRFMAQVLPADAIDLFWEFIGSSLDTNHYWPKAMMTLVGPGDSGKSKILEWIGVLIGSANAAHISFKTLADNRFATYQLFGKMMNIFADLEESEARDVGQLKALTGDDVISGEQKHKNLIWFKNKARLLFSSNHPMQVKSPDKPFFDRVFLIYCSNHFAPGAPGTDPYIVDKLSSQSNLNAGFLRMLQGYQRLVAQKWFTYSPSVMKQREDYVTTADTVTGFINARTEERIDSVVAVDSMYAQYYSFCKMGNRTPFSDQKFFRRMNESLNEFNLTREYLDVGTGRQQWCYRGRRVIPQVEEVSNGVILN